MSNVAAVAGGGSTACSWRILPPREWQVPGPPPARPNAISQILVGFDRPVQNVSPDDLVLSSGP